MQNLVFFDKEGDSLNFTYNTTLDRWEGDILFAENSNDTFKTQALYLFEKIPAFEYEDKENLTLRKFQLFNEYGFHFYQGVDTYTITKIEPVNTNDGYFSKWIYGHNIESKFSLGTFIRFNTAIFEFNNLNNVYCVVGSKKGAIMIISLMDNEKFNKNYSTFLGLTSSYVNASISGVDIIGIYNYITPDLKDTLSSWNEPTFYDRLYQYRKFNIVNTDKNDTYKKTGKFDDVEVVTIKNPDLKDIIHLEYYTSKTDLPNGSTIIIEVISKTDLPKIYNGPLTINYVQKKILFGDPVPLILKPGIEFKVPNSSAGNIFFEVGPITQFSGNVNILYYATGSQVIYENKIWECLQSYTWSAASPFKPGDLNGTLPYWTDQITYLPIKINKLSPTEVLALSEIYLANDHLYYTQSFTQSSEVTLASIAQKYQNEFKILNIDLFYENSQLKADLIYPTEYAKVNFYHTDKIVANSIGKTKIVYERAIELYERLVKEFNYDLSQNWEYNIVFTDLDEFGLIVRINKMVYEERIVWIYSSGQVDMQRTIDATIRNWLTKHFFNLNKLGILPTLITVGLNSVYYNAIRLRTDFPNVPIEFNVQVGTTADFYIEHSVVIFYLMGKYLNIKINDRNYGMSFDTDIPTTLQNWIEEWGSQIDNFGIFVSHAASTLKFNVKKQYQPVNLEITVGISTLPGIDAFKIIKKYAGNHGALITSNEILLGTASGGSLEEEGFATGQVIGINKTFYPLQNIEFNSLYLDPDIINLSYEGPFWGLTDSLCSNSPFTTVAFTIGFGQTACPPAFSPSLLKGMYDKNQYANSYSIEYKTANNYSSFQFPGIDGMVDLIYIQPVNLIYVLGNSLKVFDSINATELMDVSLPGLTNSLALCFNTVTNYVFVLSKNMLYKVDPFINLLISTYSFTSTAYSLGLNSKNGDIYVSFENSNNLGIYLVDDSVFSLNISTYSYNMVFNDFESDMYVSTLSQVVRVNGDTRNIFTQYSILAGTNSIAYDPENESIYVHSTTNLKKIDNNVISTISSVNSGTFNNLLFNNFNSSMNSSTNINFNSIFVDNDSTIYTAAPSGFGYIALNQFDGDMYIGADSKILVIDTPTGETKYVETLNGGRITKLIYDPDRYSIWGIQPSTKKIIEIQVDLSSFFGLETVAPAVYNENFYGTLSEDYIDRDYLWLHVREYIRKPRANFNGEAKVSLYWKWFSDTAPEFFMYDFSGKQLPTTGKLAYTGPKPLPTVILNRKPNKDIDKVSKSEFQQTIFSIIEEELDYIDDNDEISIVPEPLELFLGFNSPDEGALRNILQLWRKEDVDFTITTNSTNNDVLTFETFAEPTGLLFGKISLQADSTSYFFSDSDGVPRGLKAGQHLALFIKDVTNKKNQYVSNNNGYLVVIREIYSREIIVDFFKTVDFFRNEKTIVENFPETGKTTYLSCRFRVWDKEIGRFSVWGQTEIEDVRYQIELNNIGKLVSSDDVYIFKEYDIKEEGIDWNYLNSKRKEMLMVKNLIYPYIGSYKSIINAINYFGYNDLELYEYYRNVDVNSERFDQLFKVEIPDIFDNTVEGWQDKDFLKHTFPNPKFEDTNFLNLTFRITDREGNNVLYYTLEEIQKKLNGLKYWLQKNIIPITHKILDITGRTDFVNGTHITHYSRDAQIIKINQNFNPIVFDLNEAYLLPINSGSTVYNCVVEFYLNDFSQVKDMPDSYVIDIKTYEIYREWYPFKNYQKGERVVYFDKIWESLTNNNITNNPRKYENISTWDAGLSYSVADIVEYDRNYYVWTGQGTFSSVPPIVDQGIGKNWLDITDWKEADLAPIEKISEYRSINNLKPFNFTVDSNISPYIVIEVTSDNGYGMIYRDRKNFEIKGILDIQELEAFTNLTSKKYKDINLPVSVPNKVIELNMASYQFTKGFLDNFKNITDRPYFFSSLISFDTGKIQNTFVYPPIKHGFPYVIGNSSSQAIKTFAIEFGNDFNYMKNSYAITDKGNAYMSGKNLYWYGDLPPGSTVSVEMRADVTTGGRSYWKDYPGTSRNQSLVPLTYSVSAKLQYGKISGTTFSTTGNLTPKYMLLYQAKDSGDYNNSTLTFSITTPFSQITAFEGKDVSFILSTFSQFGDSIINYTQGISFSNNFKTVVDGFYNTLKNFGYVYYQVRTDSVSNKYWPNILISTYYETSSTQSYLFRYYDQPPLTLAHGPDTLEYDYAPFHFGTNSTFNVGLKVITITQSYYPL